MSSAIPNSAHFLGPRSLEGTGHYLFYYAQMLLTIPADPSQGLPSRTVSYFEPRLSLYNNRNETVISYSKSQAMARELKMVLKVIEYLERSFPLPFIPIPPITVITCSKISFPTEMTNLVTQKLYKYEQLTPLMYSELILGADHLRLPGLTSSFVQILLASTSRSQTTLSSQSPNLSAGNQSPCRHEGTTALPPTPSLQPSSLNAATTGSQCSSNVASRDGFSDSMTEQPVVSPSLQYSGYMSPIPGLPPNPMDEQPAVSPSLQCSSDTRSLDGSPAPMAAQSSVWPLSQRANEAQPLDGSPDPMLQQTSGSPSSQCSSDMPPLPALPAPMAEQSSVSAATQRRDRILTKFIFSDEDIASSKQGQLRTARHKLAE